MKTKCKNKQKSRIIEKKSSPIYIFDIYIQKAQSFYIIKKKINIYIITLIIMQILN